jgi:obg-like ATPase 1
LQSKQGPVFIFFQVENGKAQAANFPFCTINPNVGVVAIPDPRLQVLSKLSKSQQTVPTSIELVDIAGLVKGASKGEVHVLSLSSIYLQDSSNSAEQSLDGFRLVYT